MKFYGVLACLYVAGDCLLKATGHMPQSLFGADFVWLWYLIALGWLFAAWDIFVFKTKVCVHVTEVHNIHIGVDLAQGKDKTVTRRVPVRGQK